MMMLYIGHFHCLWRSSISLLIRSIPDSTCTNVDFHMITPASRGFILIGAEFSMSSNYLSISSDLKLQLYIACAILMGQ